RLGPVNRRMVAVTWMPASLADRGLGDPSREDYVSLDAHIAAVCRPREGGPRYVAGAEIGYAPSTPLASVAGTGGSGNAGGFAWQVQASVYDFAPRHHVGVAVGSAEAGWLISPDYRPNDFSAEVRYQW